MRWSRVVPLAAASAVTVAAGAVALARYEARHPTAAPSAAATEAPLPTRAPILAPLSAASAVPARSVAAILQAAAKGFPSSEALAGSVVDVTSGTTLWSQDPQVPMAPASTTKLLTAAAALETLGPAYRLSTATKETGTTLYLVGGGDPTLIRTAASPVIPAYPRPASLADLAAQTAAALAPGVPVRLRVDTSAWTGPTAATGWQPNYVTEGDVAPPSPLELDGGRLHPSEFDSERTPTPTAQAVTAFVALLRSDGVELKGGVREGVAPPTATAVASVSSPPVAALVERMLTESDNDLAEALGRAVAIHAGKPGDFTHAASAVSSAVADLGVPMADATLYDASGLSHDDRLDPSILTALLRDVAEPGNVTLRPILEGLPVAGFTGTLAQRYRGHLTHAGAGFVRAKTGTLTGVNALAGVVVDGAGQLLAFAMMATGSQPESAVEDALDRMASRLATLGCTAATAGVSTSGCGGTLER